jgi:hypothetical protein
MAILRVTSEKMLATRAPSPICARNMNNFLQHITDQTLRTDVEKLIENTPEANAVIQRLITYFVNKSGETDVQKASAKRSWEESQQPQDTGRLHRKYKLTEISFAAPERKKMDLHVGERHLLIQHYKSQFEESIPIQHLDTLVCVPTPEKAKPVYTFILFHKDPSINAIVFSLPSSSSIECFDMAESESKATKSLDVDGLCQFFKTEVKIPRILRPSPEAFASIKMSLTGQRQEVYGVKAYRKTSEGYLFFLPNAIFYGFKKPTLLFRLSEIAATSFHDITQRTFNVTLTMFPEKLPLGIGNDALVKKNRDASDDAAEGETFEFSMIDQTEYGVIDAYIKRFKINDNSMSEERKAPPPKLLHDDMDEDEDDEAAARTIKTVTSKPNDDDDDDEEDVNFQPSDNSDDDDLEYDSQASDQEEGAHGSDEEVEGQGEEEEEEEEDGEGEEEEEEAHGSDEAEEEEEEGHGHGHGEDENGMDEDEEDELDE